MKIYAWLQRLSFIVMGTLFLIVAFGSIYQFSNITLGEYVNAPFLLGFGILLCVQLFLFVTAVFRLIDYIDRKSQKAQYIITLLIFLFMIMVFLVLLCSLHPRPITDSLDDLDVAAYISSHGAVTKDNLHAYYMSMFGNNYILILLFSVFFKVLPFAEVTDALFVLYVINILSILLSVFLTWLLVKECVDLKAANKTLILCAMNPVYYGITFWIYSATLSLPIMIGILYLATKIYKSTRIAQEILEGILLGILVIIGYELRPTAIFPFIALIITVPILIIKHKLYKKVLVIGIAAFLTMGSLYLTSSYLKNMYFGEVRDQNLSLFYWFSMGSHGEGNLETNDEDNAIVNSFDDHDEMTKALIHQTINNYKKLGVSGTIDLWIRKMISTWSDGYSRINIRLGYGDIDSSLHDLIGGNHRQLYVFYSHAYRFVISLGIVLFCLVRVKEKNASVLQFSILLTVFGGVVFYMLWEAKSIYSAPFLLFMFILAQEGIDSGFSCRSLFSGIQGYGSSFIKIYALMIVLVCAIWIHLFGTEDYFVYYRVNTTLNSRPDVTIDTKGSIMQDFYVSKAFNTISLRASAETDASDYMISVSDSSGKELVQKMVDSSDVQKGCIKISFKKIQCDDHYYLTIRKMNSELGDIQFYRKDTYYLDSYKGQLSVDGNDDFVNDLNMDVMYCAEESYFDAWQAAVLIFIYILLSILCLGGIIPQDRRKLNMQG